MIPFQGVNNAPAFPSNDLQEVFPCIFGGGYGQIYGRTLHERLCRLDRFVGVDQLDRLYNDRLLSELHVQSPGTRMHCSSSLVTSWPVAFFDSSIFLLASA